MSERSIYLRDQAEKCHRHARQISDPQTQGELCKLAAEYIERAAKIEVAEIAAEIVVAIPAPPSLWPSQAPDIERPAGLSRLV
jgi:hypothetical protein